MKRILITLAVLAALMVAGCDSTIKVEGNKINGQEPFKITGVDHVYISKSVVCVNRGAGEDVWVWHARTVEEALRRAITIIKCREKCEKGECE